MNTMPRREFMVRAGMAAAALPLVSFAAPNLAPQKKRNLLFITTDEHRFDFVGAMKQQPIQTPHLDALAADGIFHTNCFSVNPLCMPARCSWLTGLYSHQHGVMNNSGDLDPTLPTFPQALQKLGYYTALVGKEHFYEGFIDLVKAGEQTKQFGFDYLWSVAGKSMASGADDQWTRILEKNGLLEKYREDLAGRMGKKGDGMPTFLPEELTVDYCVAQKSCEFIDSRPTDKPFFLWASFCNPHFPIDPVKKYSDHYTPGSFKPLPSMEKEREAGFQKSAAPYAALCEQVDAYIGTVIKKLKEKGLYDNTVIIFSADHGKMMGEHGLGDKMHPFDGSARVPFIAVGKGLWKPRTDTTAVENLDVVATMLEIAGEKNVQAALLESPSQSLVGLWSGTAKLKRQYAFSEEGYQFKPAYTMLCDGNWKYIHYSFDGKELLYNLKNDPYEMNDLSQTEAQKLSELRELTLRRVTSTPAPRPREYIYKKITGKTGKNPNQCTHKRLEDQTNTGITNIR